MTIHLLRGMKTRRSLFHIAMRTPIAPMQRCVTIQMLMANNLPPLNKLLHTLKIDKTQAILFISIRQPTISTEQIWGMFMTSEERRSEKRQYGYDDL